MKEDYKEILLNRMWRDLKQITTNQYYADLLIDRQVYLSKIFNCVVSLLSVGGAALSLVNAYIPMATGVIVGCASIAKQFFPVFFMEASEISKLSDLKSDYTAYLQQLQNIYGKLLCDCISVEDAELLYNQITAKYSDKNTMISKMFGKTKKGLNDLAIKKSDNYLNEIYYENSENNKI